jgi:hypothetical protein
MRSESSSSKGFDQLRGSIDSGEEPLYIRNDSLDSNQFPTIDQLDNMDSGRRHFATQIDSDVDLIQMK